MALLNYREVGEQLGHIEAEFVSAQLSLPERKAQYRVRLYPWWEHPLVAPGGEEGRIVTIFAHDLHEARLSQSDDDVSGWGFLDDHPLLWPYHPSLQILCTTALTTSQTDTIIDLVRAETHYDSNPYRYLNVPKDTRTFYEWTASRSFSLGHFPTPLYRKVIAHLDAIGVQYLGSGQVEDAPNLPILFFINAEDYIVAADFTIDFPGFIHISD